MIYSIWKQFFSFFVFFLFAINSLQLYAQSIESNQISGSLFETVSGDPFSPYVLSPDGIRVVYTASLTGDGNLDLFSVLVSGGEATQISRNFDRSTFFDYQISPDSTTVVYRSGGDLLSVPIGGGQVRRIDSDEKRFDSITFKISPITDRVVYTDGINLHSARMNGGDIVTLTNFDFENTDIGGFSISNDGQYVVSSTSNINTFRPSFIFSVPIAGGDVVGLTANIPEFETVTGINISPDSAHVVYRAYLSDATKFNPELFSVPIIGGQVTKLSPTPTQSDGGVGFFEITADSSQVLYSFSDTDWTGQNSDSKVSVSPINGSSPSIDLIVSLGNNCGLVVSNDSRHIINCVKSSLDNSLDFFRISLTDLTETNLNLEFPITQDNDFSLSLTSDDRYLVLKTYNFDDPTDPAADQLYSGNLNNGNIKHFVNYQSSCFTASFQVSPDNQRIVHCSASNDIFSSSISGEDELIISADDDSAPTILTFDVTSDGKYVVYLAGTIGQIFDTELYAADLTGADSNSSDELCLPIKSANGKVALICL